MATVCIAGKNSIAVQCLEALASIYDVVCLPNPEDDGQNDWQPSLLKRAREIGTPVIDIAAAYEDPELTFLSVEYSQIVRPDRFASPKLFNIHFSLLPKYRGCNTSIWPILMGEEYHGVTLHEIDPGIDTGNIIAQSSFPVAGLTARDLYMECMRLGTELVLDWAPRLIAGQYESRPQNEAEASHFFRKDMDFSWKSIDLTLTTEEVIQRVRAFTFPEYQLPLLDGIPILDARPVTHAQQPGSGRIVRATADGAVEFRLAGNPISA